MARFRIFELSIAISPKSNRGFTLVEAMIVVGIMAILAALAGPSFTTTIERYRVDTVVEELSATLSLTRNEAIKRGGNVRLVRLSGGDCPSLASAGVWSCGWQIFWDTDGDNTLDAGEEVIRQFRITNGVTVNFANDTAGVNANRWGQIGGMGGAGFNVVPPSGVGSPVVTAVCLSSGGRIRKLKGSTACP